MTVSPPVADDLDFPFDLDRRAARVVSLVPSITEALASVDAAAVVGATDWCTHPADLDTTRVRGTKNPDLKAIAALAPDVVVANKEESRELDVRRLRAAGIRVWVTEIETVAQAFTSLERLFDTALRWERPAWLVTARARWDEPPPAVRRRVAIPIWRDPWMVVGGSTFTSDLVARLGLDNAFDDADGRYPAVALSAVDRPDVDLVVLPDEPYLFTPDDGPEAFTHVPTALVSGRLLTWYGPSLLEVDVLRAQLGSG